MNWWHKFEAWVTSGEGVMGTIATAGGIIVAVYKFGGRIWEFWRKFGRLLWYHFNIEEQIWKQFNHVDKRLDRIDDRLDGLEDGVVNGIKVRRDVMEEDQKFCWFEASSLGEFEWVNRLWRDHTGMSLEECGGEGWITGLLEKERDGILRNWRACVSKQILFDRQITFVHRTTGIQTRMRLTAGPGHRGKAGAKTVVLYSGHAVRL